MLVYDITNEKSFDNIKNWIRNIEEVGMPGSGRDGKPTCHVGAFAGSHVERTQKGWGKKLVDCFSSGETSRGLPSRS